MRTSAIKDLKQQLSLYFVAGTMNCDSPEAFERILLQAIQGGVTAFQFREKGAKSLRGEKRLEIANRAKQICREHGVLFIVNDDLELMKSVDADGLHVGQKDGDLKTIREATKGKILGVSAHTLAEAEDAVSKGADYIGVGPIYQTASKEDAEEPVGVARIKEFLMNHINLPLVGIGGITIKNVSEVILAGADGAAVISALSGVDSPEEASRKMSKIIQSAKRDV
ncbi:thiamine-phosphate diphosphorylase [Fictibacillus phosphorivorans]|uniref:Thiamine-phosphate synthase n=1 Tax=Fictibacillus phosphorivorans TaxID=1221500 RepID=A0A161TJE9_9BACL|nr:thiamine phosphate synthase [Fictibacillus phosphorivorans]KZE69364.1 thiamine-phosphate diphosphorylase [Fictibacillus phosphorivorans]